MSRPVQIVIVNLPAPELDELMPALLAATPGNLWFTKVVHEDHECPHAATGTAGPECACSVLPVVFIERLEAPRAGAALRSGGDS